MNVNQIIGYTYQALQEYTRDVGVAFHNIDAALQAKTAAFTGGWPEGAQKVARAFSKALPFAALCLDPYIGGPCVGVIAAIDLKKDWEKKNPSYEDKVAHLEKIARYVNSICFAMLIEGGIRMFSAPATGLIECALGYAGAALFNKGLIDLEALCKRVEQHNHQHSSQQDGC